MVGKGFKVVVIGQVGVIRTFDSMGHGVNDKEAFVKGGKSIEGGSEVSRWDVVDLMVYGVVEYGCYCQTPREAD